MRCPRLCLILVILVGVIGCSTAEKDYSELEHVLSSNEQLLQNAQDFDSEMNICENSITAIEQYLKVHSEGEWSRTTKTNLLRWQQRLEGVQRQEKKRLDEIPKLEYAILEQLLISNDLIFQSSLDFDTRVEVCGNGITAIDAYLAKYPEGDWSATAKTTLSHWQQRLDEVHRLEKRRVADLKLIKRKRKEELPRVDYAKVEQVLTSNDLVFQNSHDFNSRIDLCENAIASIEEYLSKHSEGEWPTIARAALTNWQNRLEETTGTQTRLLDELHTMLKTRSETAAEKHHPLSKIEEIELVNSTESKQGSNFCITDTYQIRMVGTVIGRSVFKLTTEASGCIVFTSQTVEAIGEVILDE